MYVAGHKYYRELTRTRDIDCPQPQVGVRAEVFDSQIDGLMSTLKLPPVWELQVLDIVISADERQRVIRE